MTGCWLLPPDFTFLPDGQIALGNVIPDPRRPTATLASLASHPTIALPTVRTIVEKGRSFAVEKSRFFGVKLFATFLDFAGANGKVDLLQRMSRSFGATDHEVRAYNGAFSPEALDAIVALDAVKKHMRSGRFGPRHVYVISGLRVARQGLVVTDEQGKKTEVTVGGSAPAPALAGAVPVQLGVNISGAGEDTRTDGYETAPGIVFAYRLHVIRPRGAAGAEAELFSDRTAFFSGGADEEENDERQGEEVVIEAVEVDGEELWGDPDLDLDGYEERRFEWIYSRSHVVFKSARRRKGRNKQGPCGATDVSTSSLQARVRGSSGSLGLSSQRSISGRLLASRACFLSLLGESPSRTFVLRRGAWPDVQPVDTKTVLYARPDR